MILTRLKNEERLELKKELIEFINNKDFFWKMVNHINWKDLTKLGRVNDHNYMPTAKDRFSNYIDRFVRLEKLNKIDNNNSNVFYSHKTYNDIAKEYKIEYTTILKMLENYFVDTVKDAVENSNESIFLSSDSYWDLRSSIIGYGKEFMLEILEDDEIFIDMVKNLKYCENFGYIFPHKI